MSEPALPLVEIPPGSGPTMPVETGETAEQWSPGTGRRRIVPVLADAYTSLAAAAADTGLSLPTIARWVKRGRVKPVARSEFLSGAHGIMILVDDLRGVARYRESGLKHKPKRELRTTRRVT